MYRSLKRCHQSITLLYHVQEYLTSALWSLHQISFLQTTCHRVSCHEKDEPTQLIFRLKYLGVGKKVLLMELYNLEFFLTCWYRVTLLISIPINNFIKETMCWTPLRSLSTSEFYELFFFFSSPQNEESGPNCKTGTAAASRSMAKIKKSPANNVNCSAHTVLLWVLTLAKKKVFYFSFQFIKLD